MLFFRRRLAVSAHDVLIARLYPSIAPPTSCTFSCHQHAISTSPVPPDPQTTKRTIPNDGLDITHFINQQKKNAYSLPPSSPPSPSSPHLNASPSSSPKSKTKSVFIETYGCQMNVNDSEVVHTVLQQAGYLPATSPETADVVLLNTCAIRDNAESKIWQRLGYFKNMKMSRRKSKGGKEKISSSAPQPPPPVVLGVLGCMAERLKHRLLESDKMVDIVAGPDAYRDIPRLIEVVAPSHDSQVAVADNNSNSTRAHAINVQLSVDETYADVIPVRPAGVKSVYLSVMRGCSNFCSFCVVPFTRGRERSRPLQSIVDEVKMLSDQGCKEITLLGQNVNSYADFSHLQAGLVAPPHLPRQALDPQTSTNMETNADEDVFSAHYARGFRSVYRPHRDGSVTFAHLLDTVAQIDPEMRIRFTSPHPKDFSDDVLDVLQSRHNVCSQLHMPAQSGSTTVLDRMKRGYTRQAYNDLVARVRACVPGVALSTDMIAGFCHETEEEHAESVDLLQRTRFDSAFLFAYSKREPTHAAKKYVDDVPQDVKARRLQELIAVHRQGVVQAAEEEVGRRHLVLVEGVSRRSEAFLTGRTDTFKRVIFRDTFVSDGYFSATQHGHSMVGGDLGGNVRVQPGEYVVVQVVAGGGGTLRGVALARTTLQQFVSVHKSAVPLETYDLHSLQSVMAGVYNEREDGSANDVGGRLHASDVRL